jgi:hypothetical protein
VYNALAHSVRVQYTCTQWSCTIHLHPVLYHQHKPNAAVYHSISSHSDLSARLTPEPFLSVAWRWTHVRAILCRTTAGVDGWERKQTVATLFNMSILCALNCNAISATYWSGSMGESNRQYLWLCCNIWQAVWDRATGSISGYAVTSDRTQLCVSGVLALTQQNRKQNGSKTGLK